jgi:hypothetical protein
VSRKQQNRTETYQLRHRLVFWRQMIHQVVRSHLQEQGCTWTASSSRTCLPLTQLHDCRSIPGSRRTRASFSAATLQIFSQTAPYFLNLHLQHENVPHINVFTKFQKHRTLNYKIIFYNPNKLCFCWLFQNGVQIQQNLLFTFRYSDYYALARDRKYK